jgi:hypothetical protein
MRRRELAGKRGEKGEGKGREEIKRGIEREKGGSGMESEETEVARMEEGPEWSRRQGR